jgi:hypothetical protein
VQLKLANEYSTFTFVKGPDEAAKLLKEHGDGSSTAALNMVMNQADEVEAPNDKVESSNYLVDAETSVTVQSGKKDQNTENGYLVDAETGVTVQSGKKDQKTKNGKKDGKKSEENGEGKKSEEHGEADIKTKLSTDSTPEVGVVCCCGFW